MNRSIEALEMTPGRAALVMLVDRYLSGQPGKAGTLPEAKVHELMYFLQVAGEPLQLDYSKGTEVFMREISAGSCARWKDIGFQDVTTSRTDPAICSN